MCAEGGALACFRQFCPGGPPYRSDEDPERERRLEQLSQGYEGSPWLTLLVNFIGFLAVFAGLVRCDVSCSAT